VKSSYLRNGWPTMEVLHDIQWRDVIAIKMRKWCSTEWRNNVKYKKIIFNVMTSCNGNTKTKCGNTIKTNGTAVFAANCRFNVRDNSNCDHRSVLRYRCTGISWYHNVVKTLQPRYIHSGNMLNAMDLFPNEQNFDLDKCR
jgi:hypothetical protein